MKTKIIDEQEEMLFAEPDMEDNDSFDRTDNGNFRIPRIDFVKGNKVDSEGNIAWTDYRTNHIKIAELGKIFESISRELVPLYTRVHGAVHEYVRGHELNVEIAHKPQSEMQHGRFEAEYLADIEGTDAYMAGLAMHRLRKDNGSKKGKLFTKYTDHFHDLDDKFKKYEAELDEMVGLVSDVIEGKPTYQHYTDSAPSNTYRIEDYRTAVPLSEAA